MLHLLGRALSLLASVIIENKVLKANRIFYHPEFLRGKFIMVYSTISPGPYYQEVYTLVRYNWRIRKILFY